MILINQSSNHQLTNHDVLGYILLSFLGHTAVDGLSATSTKASTRPNSDSTIVITTTTNSSSSAQPKSTTTTSSSSSSSSSSAKENDDDSLPSLKRPHDTWYIRYLSVYQSTNLSNRCKLLSVVLIIIIIMVYIGYANRIVLPPPLPLTFPHFHFSR